MLRDTGESVSGGHDVVVVVVVVVGFDVCPVQPSPGK